VATCLRHHVQDHGVILISPVRGRRAGLASTSPLRPPKARTHMGTETVKRCGDGGEKGRGTADDTKEERFGMFAARPAVAKVAGAGLGAAGTRIPACLPRWGTRTGPACHHAGGQSHGRGPMPALGPWELKDPPFGPVGARGRGPLVAWGGARLARGRPGGGVRGGCGARIPSWLLPGSHVPGQVSPLG